MRGRFLIAAVAVIVGCSRPPLHVTEEHHSINVDTEILGEYPSRVERLRLTDASTHRVIWEVRGRDAPQLGKFVLNVGENPAMVAGVRHGTFDVLIPERQEPFTLASGATYVIEAWGHDGDATTKRDVTFTLHRSLH